MKHLVILFLALFFVSCNNSKSTQDTREVRYDDSNVISTDNKLIVRLAEDASVGQLEKEFVKYDLKMKSFASRSQNSYLFEFDVDKISVGKLISKINKLEWVVLASKLENKIGQAKSSQSGNKGTKRIGSQ